MRYEIGMMESMSTSQTKYLPVPFRKGCKVLRKYTEPFEDRVGNKATLTLVDYIDKKQHTMIGYVLTVKWGEICLKIHRIG